MPLTNEDIQEFRTQLRMILQELISIRKLLDKESTAVQKQLTQLLKEK